MIIKETPEDFIVNEIPGYELGDGIYGIFKLTKKGYSTVKVIEMIAQFLRCRSRDIGFAGNKDKQAVTYQFISIKGVPKNKVLDFEKDNITLEYVGQSSKPISLGDLKGNSFEIIVKDVDEPKEICNFVNYFGEQRFSVNNAEVGKLLILKKFKEALDLIIEMGLYSDKLKERLEKFPNDYIGALKILPQKTATLFVNAYQSLLWNKLVSSKLNSDEKIKISGQELSVGCIDGEVPMVGFETESSEFDEILKDEGINKRDFIVPQLSYLSAGGSFRKICVDVSNLKIEKLGEREYKLKFDLPKGCYATVFLRQVFMQT